MSERCTGRIGSAPDSSITFSHWGSRSRLAPPSEGREIIRSVTAKETPHGANLENARWTEPANSRFRSFCPREISKGDGARAEGRTRPPCPGSRLSMNRR